MNSVDKVNKFSKNLKFLRKRAGMSQTVLAERLGIKRSNIAAYESKNVEPRLNLLIEIARLLNVDLLSFVQDDLTASEGTVKSFQKLDKPIGIFNTNSIDNQVDKDKLRSFAENTLKVKKVLEGFKSFYKFKLDTMSSSSEESTKIMMEIENFIQLTDYVISHNERVISSLQYSK